ncbi:right-handed parallel beta-helix repeat-containing protein [Pseudomonas graminis]|uniref:right-handed parallel beta-helix repeat-containing protein n=1 Tax=Pseudomonas graminis TaxID=158627 RepID=UPI003C16B377
MKKILRMFVSCITLSTTVMPVIAHATDWYISPNGNDSDAGTRASPLASIMAAQERASSGDTVYLRGGTYRLATANITVAGVTNAIVNNITKDGITYESYKNEKPIFDFSNVIPTDRRVVAFRVVSDNNVFRGFEVIGVRITITGRLTQSEAFRVEGGSGNLFEALAIHDGMAIGWYLVSGSNNRVHNVDAYNNKGLDKFSYGNIDGFGVHPKLKSDTGNVIEGCRAWFNSDDGFDLIGAWAAVTLKNNWAFNNGRDRVLPTKLGDGNGFKAGGYGSNGSNYPRPVPRHMIRSNLAVNNKANGFYANHQVGGQDWINNTAIRNARANYDMLSTLPDNATDVPGYDHNLVNNVGFDGRVEIANLGKSSENNIGKNSFSIPLRLTANDFVSLDQSQLERPRQANGDLPKITFGTPSIGSAMINAGSDAGGAYNGSAPDLGAFESP